MSIPASRKNKKLIVYVAVAASCVILGLVALLYFAKLGPFSQKNPSGTIDYNPPTQEEIQAGEDIKSNSESTGGGSDPSPTPTPSTDGTKASVGMDITAANQDSGTLYIRALIQTVSSSGTCSLSMRGPSGKTYSATATVQALPSTSTCAGFNVPIDSLSTGTWTITINFENGSVKANATREVVIT